jgi:hypothetical protein
MLFFLIPSRDQGNRSFAHKFWSCLYGIGLLFIDRLKRNVEHVPPIDDMLYFDLLRKEERREQKTSKQSTHEIDDQSEQRVLSDQRSTSKDTFGINMRRPITTSFSSAARIWKSLFDMTGNKERERVRVSECARKILLLTRFKRSLFERDTRTRRYPAEMGAAQPHAQVSREARDQRPRADSISALKRERTSLSRARAPEMFMIASVQAAIPSRVMLYRVSCRRWTGVVQKEVELQGCERKMRVCVCERLSQEREKCRMLLKQVEVGNGALYAIVAGTSHLVRTSRQLEDQDRMKLGGDVPCADER